MSFFYKQLQRSWSWLVVKVARSLYTWSYSCLVMRFVGSLNMHSLCWSFPSFFFRAKTFKVTKLDTIAWPVHANKSRADQKGKKRTMAMHCCMNICDEHLCFWKHKLNTACWCFWPNARHYTWRCLWRHAGQNDHTMVRCLGLCGNHHLQDCMHCRCDIGHLMNHQAPCWRSPTRSCFVKDVSSSFPGNHAYVPFA